MPLFYRKGELSARRSGSASGSREQGLLLGAFPSVVRYKGEAMRKVQRAL